MMETQSERAALRKEPVSKADVLVSLANEMIRCGLSHMLSELSIVGSVQSCADSTTTAELLHSGDFDVVIVSLYPSVSAVQRVLHEATERGVYSLLLLRHADDALLPEVAELPVDGFILETGMTRDGLFDAIQRLVNGEMPLPGALARRILAELRTNDKPRSDAPFMLTPRERQALTLLAEGLSNKQIARRLGISEHGAKRHVGNVLAKLNCPNRTVAVTVALQHGLLNQQGPNESIQAQNTPAHLRTAPRYGLLRRNGGSGS